MIEKQITKKIQKHLKSQNIFHWKVWQGAMSTKGVSDIIGIYNGKLLAIEVKVPGNKPTALQQRFIDAVNSHGGLAFVATSVDDVIDGLK